MQGSLLFLGTGASRGVPVIGCSCDVCQSDDPKNKRLRSSVLLELPDDKKFLIDVGPDFREQALKHKINNIDGLLITHIHYDHIGGIDDMRVLFFKRKKPIPCLLSKEAFYQLKIRYEHLFKRFEKGASLAVQFDFTLLENDFGKIVFEEIEIDYFSYAQGKTPVLGYRIGNFAYVTDIKDFSERIFDSLLGVEVLVVSALRKNSTTMQFGVEDAITFSKKVGAKMTYFTHVDHDIEFKTWENQLPSGFAFAYDGLKIFFEADGRKI